MVVAFILFFLWTPQASAQAIWGKDALDRIPLPTVRYEGARGDPRLEADIRELRGSLTWYVESLRSGLQRRGRGSLRLGSRFD